MKGVFRFWPGKKVKGVVIATGKPKKVQLPVNR